MSKEEREKINEEYDNYYYSHTKKNHALPFIIWLQHKENNQW